MDWKKYIKTPTGANNGRKWWIAGFLSYFVPGLGQIYNGQAEKGLLLYSLFSIWISLFVTLTLNTIKSSFSQFLFIALFTTLIVYLTAWALVIFEAIRTAEKTKKDFRLKVYNRWYYYFLAIILVQFINYALRDTIKRAILKPYRITSISMAPTLLDGDNVFTDPMTYSNRNPQRGDVIVLSSPDNDNTAFIKRIIGMPGDTLQIINKAVFINRKKLDEKYAVYLDPVTHTRDRHNRDHFGPVVIHPNSYFVMGDNRDYSYDSRHWGNVARENIIGKTGIIYLSSQNTFPFIRWNRIGHRIQ